MQLELEPSLQSFLYQDKSTSKHMMVFKDFSPKDCEEAVGSARVREEQVPPI